MNQDPIELWGGDNLYWFGPNVDMWRDPWGVAKRSKKGEIFADSKGLSLEVRNPQDLSHMSECTLRYMAEEGVSGTTKGGRGKMWENGSVRSDFGNWRREYWKYRARKEIKT